MGEFFFVLKTMIFTVGLVMLMQIRVGEFTLEEHSIDWIRDSFVTETLRGVADGAIRVSKQLTSHFDSGGSLSTDTTVKAKSSKYSWEIKRSDAYHKEQKKKRAQKDDSSEDEE